MPDFFIHFVFGRDRFCNLLPQNRPKAVAQPVNRHINCIRAEPPFLRHLHASHRLFAAGEEAAQIFKPIESVCFRIFLAQCFSGSLQQLEYPLALIQHIRSDWIGWFEDVPCLRILAFEWDGRAPTASPLRQDLIALVCEKVLHTGQQEGPELPAGGMHIRQPVTL